MTDAQLLLTAEALLAAGRVQLESVRDRDILSSALDDLSVDLDNFRGQAGDCLAAECDREFLLRSLEEMRRWIGDPVPLGKLVPAAEPLETEPFDLDAEAQRLADAWEADHAFVNPNDLAPDLRTRVGAILRARRAASTTTGAHI